MQILDEHSFYFLTYIKKDNFKELLLLNRLKSVTLKAKR